MRNIIGLVIVRFGQRAGRSLRLRPARQQRWSSAATTSAAAGSDCKPAGRSGQRPRTRAGHGRCQRCLDACGADAARTAHRPWNAQRVGAHRNADGQRFGLRAYQHPRCGRRGRQSERAFASADGTSAPVAIAWEADVGDGGTSIAGDVWASLHNVPVTLPFVSVLVDNSPINAPRNFHAWIWCQP